MPNTHSITPNLNTPIVLSIAGSDPSGGAGIQADIKAISATGSFACNVITALTAQNTCGVQGILTIDTNFIAQQLDSVFSDLNIIAVKIGMLSEASVINVVAKKLQQYQPQFIVIDPVMVATSGDPLLKTNALNCLIDKLLPLASIITPNIPEACILTNRSQPKSESDLMELMHELQGLSIANTLLKGGHLYSLESSPDWLISSSNIQTLSAPRIASKNTHGTGCSLSSAIASYLAQGHNLCNSVRLAKQYVHQAIRYSDKLQVGQGNGPIHHFFKQPSYFNNEISNVDTKLTY